MTDPRALLAEYETETAATGPAEVPAFDALLGDHLTAFLADKLTPLDAVPTMFPSWNRACRDDGGGVGLARTWHCIIAGTSGSGKSLVAGNLAATAIQHGEQVGYVTLEMSQAQLETRLLAIVSGTSVRRLEKGTGYDPKSAATAARELNDIRQRTGGTVYVNRRPLHRLTDISAAFRSLHEQHGCEFFVTDYMQLAWANARSMFENIQEVSHTIRGLAVDLNVVSIGLSQFNRETSVNRGQAPTIHGLMGGSVLENDADQVLLLDHSCYERQGLGEATGKVKLAKNRHGPSVDIPVRWDYSTLRIHEDSQAVEEEPAVPGRGDAWEPGA